MIKNAEFITSSVMKSDLVDNDLVHVLLLGRSNVGKSSLINAVTNRKSLARISKVPGKTITLNYYLINDSIYLVDAPGYGYAKRSKTQAESFIVMIKSFIEDTVNLKKIFILVDFKVGPTKDDLALYYELTDLNLNIIIVVTKYDKVKSSFRLKQEKDVIKHFIPGQKIYFTSSANKTGIDKIINEILHE